MHLDPEQPVGVTGMVLARAVIDRPAGSPILLHGRTTDLARACEATKKKVKRFSVIGERRRKGFAAAVITR